MADTLRVEVTLTLDVDPEAWELTHRNDVKEDVALYVLRRIQQSTAAEEKAITCVLPATLHTGYNNFPEKSDS